MQVASVERKKKVRTCKAPHCGARVRAAGKKFCPVCQEKLDRVRHQLELEERDGKGRLNGHVVMPTAETLNPQKAATFDEGLRRRAGNGNELSGPERITRAVRIVQMMKANEPVEAIITQLCLKDREELENELAMYRARSAERAQKWSGGLKRDIATDRAILNRIGDPDCERKQLAKDLGLTDAALASRLRRLRNEGHQIPYRRKSKQSTTA